MASDSYFDLPEPETKRSGDVSPFFSPGPKRVLLTSKYDGLVPTTPLLLTLASDIIPLLSMGKKKLEKVLEKSKSAPKTPLPKTPLCQIPLSRISLPSATSHHGGHGGGFKLDFQFKKFPLNKRLRRDESSSDKQSTKTPGIHDGVKESQKQTSHKRSKDDDDIQRPASSSSKTSKRHGTSERQDHRHNTKGLVHWFHLPSSRKPTPLALGSSSYLPSEAQRISTPPAWCEPQFDPHSIEMHSSLSRRRSQSVSKGNLEEDDVVRKELDDSVMNGKSGDYFMGVNLNIPDHLPSSPLCPRNPENKSRGVGFCIQHGRN